MFEAIGRGGNVKELSKWRWVNSVLISIAIGAASYGVVLVIKAVPQSAESKSDEPTEVTFQVSQKLPPPPPPPPAPPKSTVRPMRPHITKTVVQQEIKPPEPTPVPEKQPEQKEEPPKEDLAAAGGGDASGAAGVPGGVVGGVIGGVVGGDASAPPANNGIGDVQEVDVNDVKTIKRTNPKMPEAAKRNRISGTVVVEVTCSADGKVVDVSWISGNDIFKDAVLEAFKEWEFEPRPIPFKVRYAINMKVK